MVIDSYSNCVIIILLTVSYLHCQCHYKTYQYYLHCANIHK